MHTPYSDGEGWHVDIAKAANLASLDFVVVTDHNVLVQGVEGYYGDEESGYTLVLTGEEVHDQQRDPQVNHMLVYADVELAQCAADPQGLIDAANQINGLTFLAHPTDPPISWAKIAGLPWADLHVEGYTGLEIWNYMTSFKATAHGTMLKGAPRLLRSIFRPEEHIIGPAVDALALWDKLLIEGKRIVGIGNSDAHATVFKLGPMRHTIFPYDFLFSCVNTHVMLPAPLSGNWQIDRAAIFKAVRQGNCFVGYEIPGSTRGFRYSASGVNGTTIMGGSIRLGQGVTLQTHAPDHSRIKMIFEGKVVAESQGRENLTYTARQPGAYRVEVWRHYHGKERGWIFSNPIYVEA